ncbi:hypothetical protein ACH9EU_01990 [Kocuria sp. M1R5S2]|uniref:hypothetical protein n=1 Tax=Kocuria rhizosphaerae TaxID=3376285 RepID=UPI0037A6BB22
MDTTNSTTGTPRARSRSSGLVVLISGILIIIGSAGSSVLDGLWVVMLIGFLGMVYGMPGVHHYQAPADGALGKWGAQLIRFGGAVIVLLGLAFLVWEAVGTPPESGPAAVDVAWMAGFAVFVIGVILFAIGVVRAKVLPVASGVLMLVGLVGSLVVDMATGAFFESEPVTTEWGFLIGVPVFGLGLAWAGYSVWKGAGARSGTGPAAVGGAPQPA